jgi:peptidase E
LAKVARQHTMKPPNRIAKNRNETTMSDNDQFVKKIRQEFAKFETAMEELNILKQVAQDLKNFREMIVVKKYD